MHICAHMRITIRCIVDLTSSGNQKLPRTCTDPEARLWPLGQLFPLTKFSTVFQFDEDCGMTTSGCTVYMHFWLRTLPDPSGARPATFKSINVFKIMNSCLYENLCGEEHAF